MIIGNHVEKVVNDGKVVLANQETGSWIRISEEVYIIIENILKCNMNYTDMEECFEDKEDYILVRDIYKTLIKSNIICSENYSLDMKNKIASVQLTNRCNLQCVHCCVDAEFSNESKLDLETDSVKMIFDKLVLWNPLNIMLSGGEPMIRTDFMELLCYLREKYAGKIVLSTNSLLINQYNVIELVKNCDSFEISIDGIDEETCSKVRGKGVFGQVCKKVNMLKEFGATNINLSMVFSDQNQDLMQPFRELNNKLGTTAVCRVFSPIGRGDKNKSLFSNKSEEDIYIPSEYLSNDYDDPFGISTCSAGKKEIFIGDDGILYPCPSYMSENFAIGNVLESYSIEDILKDNPEQYISEHIIKSHPQKISKCKQCKVRLFCWTCPGELRDIKTEKAFNKRCDLLKPILLERVWKRDINY